MANSNFYWNNQPIPMTSIKAVQSGFLVVTKTAGNLTSNSVYVDIYINSVNTSKTLLQHTVMANTMSRNIFDWTYAPSDVVGNTTARARFILYTNNIRFIGPRGYATSYWQSDFTADSFNGQWQLIEFF